MSPQGCPAELLRHQGCSFKLGFAVLLLLGCCRAAALQRKAPKSSIFALFRRIGTSYTASRGQPAASSAPLCLSAWGCHVPREATHKSRLASPSISQSRIPLGANTGDRASAGSGLASAGVLHLGNMAGEALLDWQIFWDNRLQAGRGLVCAGTNFPNVPRS